MRKSYVLIFLFSLPFALVAQVPNWQSFTDSIQSLSSPRSCDLNNDGTLDIVVGAGLDGIAHPNGIIAMNGLNGSLLWKRPARDEVFGSAIFQDINSDGVKDVFISGRKAQLLALNGTNGNLLWDYFPYPSNPVDSGLYNFYNPQFIPDVSGDLIPDILVSNGGDHAAPVWQTNRPPGHLMVVNAVTGNLIAKAVVPDSAEIYCSPIVAEVQGNGVKWILFGTGGENLGGHFYACPLTDLIQTNSLANSIVLATDNSRGYIAPASVARADQGQSIFIQSFGGEVTKINGHNWTTAWSTTIPGTESSAAPVIGRMNADLTPDVFVLLYKGIAPSYSDFYQVMLDGLTGTIAFKDSLGVFSYPSANAIDLNNDGVDEAVVSVTYNEAGVLKHKLHAIDFTASSISQIDATRTGVNLGCTPHIVNMDNDASLELIYVVKKDSVNPVGSKGIFINCINLSSNRPNNGIAWGSYMGTKQDGHYQYSPVNCGFGSTIASVNIQNPSCNTFSNGNITPIATGQNAPYTYLWSNGQITPTLNNVPAGAYWVRITDANNCFEERSVNLVDPYVISFGGIASPSCPGDTNGMATLNSSGCSCMFSTCTFLWDNGVTTKPNNSLVEGWNSVTINHPNGCVVVDSVFIPSPSPIIDSVQIQHIDCFGNSTGLIELVPSTAAGGVHYEWENGNQTNSITGLTAGTYSVVLEDSRSCEDSLMITVLEPDALIVDHLATDVLCHGGNSGSIQWSIQGGTMPYTSSFSNQVAQTTSVSGLSEGNYTIEVTDSNNCMQSIQVVLTEPAPLSLTLNSTPASGMNSLDGIIIATPSGGTAPYSYLWNVPQSDSTIVYLNPGNYTLQLSDQNGCTIDTSLYIGVLSLDEQSLVSIELFPNPVTDKLQVKGGKTDADFSIYSVTGQLIKEGKLNENAVYVGDISEGMYYIKFKEELIPFLKK